MASKYGYRNMEAGEEDNSNGFAARSMGFGGMAAAASIWKNAVGSGGGGNGGVTAVVVAVVGFCDCGTAA